MGLEPLSATEIRILKKIKKNPDKVFPENANKFLGKHSLYIVNFLDSNGYIDRKFSEDDKISCVMGLDVKKFSGSWFITEKGYAALKENSLLFKRKLGAGIIGYLLGIITAIVPVFVQFLLS